MLLAMAIVTSHALLVPTSRRLATPAAAAGSTLSRRTAIFSAVPLIVPFAASASDSDDEFSDKLRSARDMLEFSASTMTESPERTRFAVSQTMPYLTYKGYRCGKHHIRPLRLPME